MNKLITYSRRYFCSPVSCSFWKERIIHNFENTPLMSTLQAEITDLQHGNITISMPYDKKLSQHNGYLHGGIISSLVDASGGFSAISTFPPHSSGLTVEFKIHFLRPAVGIRFKSVASVIKLGKTLTICDIKFYSIDQDNNEILTAVSLQTIMCLTNKYIQT